MAAVTEVKNKIGIDPEVRIMVRGVFVLLWCLLSAGIATAQDFPERATADSPGAELA